MAQRLDLRRAIEAPGLGPLQLVAELGRLHRGDLGGLHRRELHGAGVASRGVAIFKHRGELSPRELQVDFEGRDGFARRVALRFAALVEVNHLETKGIH